MNYTVTGAAFRIIVATLLLAISPYSTAQPKIPPKYTATGIEIGQLPKYCAAQYIDGAYFGHPIYSIPEACGTYTNHFCPGLVKYMQGTEFSKPKAQRRELLRMAADDMQYTLSHITPSCPIYADTQNAARRVEMMRNMLK